MFLLLGYKEVRLLFICLVFFFFYISILLFYLTQEQSSEKLNMLKKIALGQSYDEIFWNSAAMMVYSKSHWKPIPSAEHLLWLETL